MGTRPLKVSWVQGFAGQRAVPYFTPAGARIIFVSPSNTGACCIGAYTSCCPRLLSVEYLHVAHGAESGYRHNLGLSACKHRRTVRPFKKPDFTPDGTYLFKLAAVGANSFIDYLVP